MTAPFLKNKCYNIKNVKEGYDGNCLFGKREAFLD